MSIPELESLAQLLLIDWTAELDPSAFDRFQLGAVQVFAVSGGGGLPVLRPSVKADVAGNQLRLSVTLDGRVRPMFVETGGFLLIDLVCDLILDGRGTPVSAALFPLVRGSGTAVPGGLMRLTLPVQRG